jgi:hypothetical protein
MITNAVDAAIGSGCHGTLDEAIRVIDEHFDANRSRAKGSRGIPAVVRGFTEKERGTGHVQPDYSATIPQLGRTERPGVPPRRR